MLSCIICFFSLILMLTGLFFIFYLTISGQYTHRTGYFVAVEGREENENLAEQVYAAYIQANLMNFSQKRPVYVFDRNLSEETKSALISTVVPYGKIVFIDAPSDDIRLQ